MQTETIDLAGVQLDLTVQGSGPPMLYLHPEHYSHLHSPFVAQLAQHWTVYAPCHPGFDGRRPPDGFQRIDDLAYLYLDLLERLDLKSVAVLGASFGGWVALEIAIRDSARLRALSLIAPLGVKFGEREERGFTDLSALPEDEAARCLFAGTPPDFGTFSSDELVAVAQDRQYLAYYAWKPYLYNPALVRWLHRVTVPTHLLWGADDGYAAPALGERLAARIPQARLDILPGAGHYPQIECPDETLAALAAGPSAPGTSKTGE